jgi:protein-disulfide isomerase
MKTSHVIPIAILAGGLIVAGALYLSLPKGAGTASDKPELARAVGTGDHILGNPAARVVVVEYSDFECPACKDFDGTLHQVIANEGATGKVAWVFRHFPLIEIHKNALAHAKAAECAAQVGGNDGFWKFKDLLFKNQPADLARYGEIAAAAGLPGEAFAACYANTPEALTARIMADRQNAFDIGAKGTPYSVIIVDGKPSAIIDGAYPYDAVKQLLDQALR